MSVMQTNLYKLQNNDNVVFRPERFYLLIYKLANCKFWKSENEINRLQ